jgi:hypothetical protein
LIDPATDARARNRNTCAACSSRQRKSRRCTTSYDAAYVALAEVLAIPLVTLDRRISRAPGITCSVSVPGGAFGR